MAALSISHLVKHYEDRKILHGIDLNIQDGEFLALVGPSGCGKSTLLRTIAGLETSSEGTITMGNRVLNDVAPKDRDMAMVFQNYALYPHLTVNDNLGFALKIKGVEQRTRQEQIQRVAAALGLEQELDRYPRQLSGGQRQRVAMGRAIIRRPSAFLFDEPLSNLDAKLRIQMRTEIKTLHQKLRTTTIYVTHDQVEAMTMADRIVVMRQGRIEQIGTPLQLYDRPVNAFVAAFIGSPAMNLLPGVVQHIGQSAYVNTAEGFVFPVPALSCLAGHGTRVLVGIRPEHLRISQNDDGLQARVIVVEPTGSETHVATKLGNHSLLISLRERFSREAGSTIRLLPDVNHIHVFDEESGQRLNHEI